MGATGGIPAGVTALAPLTYVVVVIVVVVGCAVWGLCRVLMWSGRVCVCQASGSERQQLDGRSADSHHGVVVASVCMCFVFVFVLMTAIVRGLFDCVFVGSVLRLNNNLLSGSVPSELWVDASFRSLQYVRERVRVLGVGFCGVSVASCLCVCRELNLGGNSGLTGTLPTSTTLFPSSLATLTYVLCCAVVDVLCWE